ncbi:amidase [Streptosporangium saharense]|uniref:amidase n=1 Tax=Streptosporangium saharense TaxID=1706840 RepID=UPI00343509EC
MELHEYARHDAVGLRDLIAAGEVTADEVEQAARAALAAADAELNALALPPFTPALDHAADGPLAGVPFLIKDSGPMARGVPSFLGSRGLETVPGHDSELMTRLRAAGLVTLGLTTVPELVVSFSTESLRHGPTRNPWDLGRGVGGSSGGAAALVAAGAVPLAHGTDGAGSIRVPASCCGLVGLKPSRGRVSSGPDAAEVTFGMSCDFGLARTVRDAATLLDAVHGPAAGDKYTAPPPARRYTEEVGADPGRLRVAVTTAAWSGVAVDPEVAAATVATGRVLEGMGHLVTEASPEVDWDLVLGGVVPVAVACVASAASSGTTPPDALPDPERFEAVTRHALDVVGDLGALDLMAALAAQNRVTRSVGAFFTGHDILVTPTLGQLPAPHGTLRYDDPGHTMTTWHESLFAYGPFTVVFNIAGLPAVSLPLGWSRDGLPIGVQLVAPYGREDLLLRLASRLEEAVPWRDRTPGVFVGA